MPARELGGLRQQLVQMAFPAGWVGLVVGDVAQRLRGVEHDLDAPDNVRMALSLALTLRSLRATWRLMKGWN